MKNLKVIVAVDPSQTMSELADFGVSDKITRISLKEIANAQSSQNSFNQKSKDSTPFFFIAFCEPFRICIFC